MIGNNGRKKQGSQRYANTASLTERNDTQHIGAGCGSAGNCFAKK